MFSADTNVIGTYDVTVSATQSASGIHFEEGTVTLNGGTINLANAATVNVAAGLTSTINSVLTGSAGLTQSGSGTLVLGGVNTYSGNTMLASSPVDFQYIAARRLRGDSRYVRRPNPGPEFEL